MRDSTFFVGVSLVLLAAACGDDTNPKGGESPGGSPPTSGGNGGDGGDGGNGGIGVGAGGDGGDGGAPIVGGSGGEGGVPPEGGAPPIDPDGNPPEPPIGAPPGDGSAPRVFAVDHLFSGIETFQGVESADAWQGFGYDIDLVDTTSSFAGHCLPVAGAAPNNIFPDGLDGIDNAFGKVLLPILKTASATSGDFEIMVNEPFENGEYSLLFDVSSLGPDANYSPLPSSFFQARDRVGSTWLKAPESFSGATPLLAFPDAYSNNDTWVSRRVDGTLIVNLSVGGSTMKLTIHRPLVSAEMSADHDTVTRGIISGILDTDELSGELANAIAAIEPSFCNGAAIDGIINQVRQASDIMADGTQAAGQECTGISIGLGFTATSVSVGDFALVEPPPPDPCP
jgi:hypothetical protein